MNRRRFLIILVLILAFLLRYWKIGEFPQNLYGDEQAFAWNAWNILKTGQDEYGTPFPLQFRSFDDYKAPIPVYLLVPLFNFMGMNAYSIRLPVVLFSFATVFLFYFFCRLRLNVKISLLAVFLFSISPWHIHLSRGYFEAVISLFFFMFGIHCFFASGGRLKWMVVSALFFSLSMYSYFTPRLLLPLFIPFLIFSTKLKLKSSFVFLAVLFVTTLPLLYVSIFGRGLSRLNKLNETVSSVVTSTVNRERSASLLPDVVGRVFHNKPFVWLRLVKNNYLEHLSLNFWYLYGDNSLRYFLGNMGMFYLFELPFLLLGMVYILKSDRKLFLFLAGWLLLAPIPASIVGRSFAVRSLSMLPAPFIFVSAGIYYSLVLVRLKYKKILISVLTLVVAGYFSHLLIRYYLEYPVYAATWWGYENKAALDYAKKMEDRFDNIFISDYYTGAPLAFAVDRELDPIAFRESLGNPVTVADGRKMIKIGKYYFGSLDLDAERLEENLIPPKSLYIGRPEEAFSSETINAPDDGRVLFNIFFSEP